MSTITDATEMPRRIWIEPECCAGGDVTEQRWAEDDIFDCDEGAEATEYVRADLAKPRVKKLEWREIHMSRSDEDPRTEVIGWESSTAFDHDYVIDVINDGFEVSSPTEILAIKDTPDEAKAAAQADYESRILSALEGDDG